MVNLQMRSDKNSIAHRRGLKSTKGVGLDKGKEGSWRRKGAPFYESGPVRGRDDRDDIRQETIGLIVTPPEVS